MRIAIATVQVPFIQGGAEVLASGLMQHLSAEGHEVDIITIPFKWYPEQALLDVMLQARMVDLQEVNGVPTDRVIALKFPMYYVRHTNKTVWLLHQHRQAYELWGTKFGDLDRMPHGLAVRELIMKNDEKYLGDCKALFTISKTVSHRLEKYNKLKSTPLYHPPLGYEDLYCGEYSDYVFCLSRIDVIKRQRILVEALRYTRTNVKVVLAGSADPLEKQHIEQLVSKYSLQDRVLFEGLVSDEKKRELYANCLAVYYGPYEEDYGYVTLEALFSQKAVITLADSGGPLEFITDGENGFVVEDDPRSVAEKLDLLYENRTMASQMGKAGLDRLRNLNVNWKHVVERLTT